MIDSTSRYAAIGNAHYVAPDGSRVIYKQRRFLPQRASAQGAPTVTVRAGERLDTIAARALGDPLQFWRIADANGAMNPFDLTQAGATLVVPSTRLAGARSS
jgi:nucleoid-associated protein YgaU